MECANCNRCGASNCEGYGLVNLYQGGDEDYCSNKHMNQWPQDWELQDEDEEDEDEEDDEDNDKDEIIDLS